MSHGLTIIEPTTILRDWLRTEFDEAFWAGGWPQGVELPGTIIHPVGSTLDIAITRWSLQLDSFATTQPAASARSAALATLLVSTPTRTELGATDDVTVLYGGAVEDTVSIFPKDPDSEDPGTYGSTLLLDLLTIAVPNP
jgi:hypothetical protein